MPKYKAPTKEEILREQRRQRKIESYHMRERAIRREVLIMLHRKAKKQDITFVNIRDYTNEILDKLSDCDYIEEDAEIQPTIDAIREIFIKFYENQDRQISFEENLSNTYNGLLGISYERLSKENFQ